MCAVPNSNIQILNSVIDNLQTICPAQFVCASITHLHAKLHISSHNVSTVIIVNLKAEDSFQMAAIRTK